MGGCATKPKVLKAEDNAVPEPAPAKGESCTDSDAKIAEGAEEIGAVKVEVGDGEKEKEKNDLSGRSRNSDDDVEVLQARCHYSQAEVDGCIFNLNGDAYVKSLTYIGVNVAPHGMFISVEGSFPFFSYFLCIFISILTFWMEDSLANCLDYVSKNRSIGREIRLKMYVDHCLGSFGAVADVFLWRNKKISAGALGGATAMWADDLPVFIWFHAMSEELSRGNDEEKWEALALLLIGISVNQMRSLPEDIQEVTVPSLASVFNEYALKSQFETSIYLQRVKEVSVPAGQRSARHSLRFHRGRSNRVVEKVASGLSIGVDQYPYQKALGCRSVEEEGGELEVGGFRSLPFLAGAGDLLQGRSTAGVSLDGPDRWGLFSCSGQEAGPSHKQVGSTSGPLRPKALEAIVGGPGENYGLLCSGGHGVLSELPTRSNLAEEDPFLLDPVFERLRLYSSARTRRRKMDVEVESAGLGCAKTPRADSPVVPLLDLRGGGVTFTGSVSSPGSSSSLELVESFHQEVHGQCGVATLLELQPYCLQLLGSYVEGQVEGQGISAFSQGSSTRERWSVASTSAAEVDSGEEISVKVGLVASEDVMPIASTGVDFLDSSGVIQAAELESSVELTPAAKGVRVSLSSGDVESDGVVRDGAGLSGSYPHPGMSLALASSAPLFASFEGSEEGGLRGNQISDSLAVCSAGHPGVEDDCLSRGPSERGSQGIRVDSVVVEGGVGSAIPQPAIL
ncbi:hypothetical protein HHK36_020128 [Tetracentron sinense]|uniref:Uncharacterized protein n=1 Tax=Tetracentron sinense TaxID=13715 RepID=A0A834YWK8_TETSI|nr:hypothetical protein HHK36_020128 [Tetracentron sinense]